VRQQLFQRQPALCGMGAGGQRGDIGIARRAMHAQQRLAQRRQAQVAQHFRRQQFQRSVIGKEIQRLPDQLAQGGRADAFDGGIDRVQFLAQRCAVVFVQHAIAGMNDLQPVLPRLGRAVAAHQRAGNELRHLRGAEMEEAQHQGGLRVVADGHAQQRAITETALHRFHPPFHLRRHSRLQRADGRELGAVFVAQRQMQPQILQRQQSARRQFFGHARTHADKLSGDGLVEDGFFAAWRGRHLSRMPTAPD
jgi:hypothetical protein